MSPYLAMVHDTGDVHGKQHFLICLVNLQWT